MEVGSVGIIIDASMTITCFWCVFSAYGGMLCGIEAGEMAVAGRRHDCGPDSSFTLFLASAAVRPPFPDWAAYQQMAGVIQNYPDIKHLFLPFSFMTNWGWSDIMGAFDYQQFVATTPAQGIGMLAGIVTALGLGYGLIRTIRDKAYRMLTGLLGGIVGLYFVMSVPARLHYYQVMAPYIAIIIAIGLIKLFRSQPLFLKPTIGFIVAANLLFTGMFWRYLSVNQGVMGDYGVPYKYASPRVMQSIQPYIYRKDIDAITTYAHFDPSLAKFSQGASIHAYLSKYFLMIDEPVLASAEAKLAEPLIK